MTSRGDTRTLSEPQLEGFVAPGYEPVRRVFVENFGSRHEVGAACAVYLGGRLVVDLWGGIADRRTGRPWDAETAAVIFVRSAGPQASGRPDGGARRGTGFELSSPPTQPMLGSTSFGHAGAGGQLAFGDVEPKVGSAYLASQMGGYGDARARELTLALRRVLAA